MNRLVEVTLGTMSAVGGFVDVGELVFASQAGARFLSSLLWVLAIATVGLFVFGDMAGRVAAVAHQPVFTLVRQRLGLTLGLITLVASTVVNVITCAAEIGGIAVVLELLTGAPYQFTAVVATLVLILTAWALPFRWVERSFGLLGLLMLSFVATSLAIQPDWSDVAHGLIPNFPIGASLSTQLVYAYFAVGLLSAVLMPYEIYFCASGGIEEGWRPGELGFNRLMAFIGFALGSLVTASLMVNAAYLFAPHGLAPQLIGTPALAAAIPFGKTGLILALLGMLFAIGGGAVQTSFAGAYNLAQFFGWEWGRYRIAREAPRFALAWIGVFCVGLVLVLAGIDPMSLVRYAVLFSVVILPLSYIPLLLVAGDERTMGQSVNGKVATTLGWIYLVVITVAALAAIPLFIATSGGGL